MNRVGILFSSFGPYHVTRIDTLGGYLRAEGFELVAFRFSETSDTYGWKPERPEDVPTITLSDMPPANVFDALRLAKRFRAELRSRSIQAVFLPSYSPMANFLCFLMSKSAGCRTILMTESWHGTDNASPLKKGIKHFLVRMFNAALVGGEPHRDYVVGYGLPAERVFTGYDVVDVDKFSSHAKGWKGADRLPIEGLPSRFFLNLGRFVKKKNLSMLVAAYARFCSIAYIEPDKSKQAAIALVLVGEGPLRSELENHASRLGLSVRDGILDKGPSDGPEVVFYPFQQVDVTPLFFARCEAFILPSTREEWGLVVNEAMASGAPVLVSNRVGCQSDLVEPGVNGFVFDPELIEELLMLLIEFHYDDTLSARLGEQSIRVIQQWRPERFGNSGLKALKAALSK